MYLAPELYCIYMYIQTCTCIYMYDQSMFNAACNVILSIVCVCVCVCVFVCVRTQTVGVKGLRVQGRKVQRREMRLTADNFPLSPTDPPSPVRGPYIYTYTYIHYTVYMHELL